MNKFLIFVACIVGTYSATVVAWGNSLTGGEPLRYLKPSDLENVTTLVGNAGAFAALRDDGTVISWGKDSYGGDSSTVAKLLAGGASKIVSTTRNFGALLKSGRFVVWGGFSYNPDPYMMSGVADVFTSPSSFMCVETEGTIGIISRDDRYRYVEANYKSPFKKVFSNDDAFAALTANGNINCWGDPNSGGNTTTVDSYLHDVVSVLVGPSSFAAIRDDGKVVNWGSADGVGNSATVDHLLQNVTSLVSITDAFAAQTSSGDIVVWGDKRCQADANTLAEAKDSIQIVGTKCSFAAITKNKTVVVWGASDPETVSTVNSLLKDVEMLYAGRESFVAVTTRGDVVSWGSVWSQHADTSTVNHLLKNITKISFTRSAFAALVESPMPIHHSSVKMSNMVIIIAVVGWVLIGTFCVIRYILQKSKKTSEPLLDDDHIDSELQVINDALPSSHEIPREQLTHFEEQCVAYFGKVFSAKYSNQEIVTVKESKSIRNANFIEEIRLLSLMRQKDIVRFYGWSREDKTIYLVTQYYNESLHDVLKSGEHNYRAPLALKMISIARALAYIHGLGLAHLCVAARNIFLNHDELVLGNMETATKIGSSVPFKLPLAWCPPEGLQATVPQASTAHDVWGFGCALYEILTCSYPYSNMIDDDSIVDRKQQVINLIKRNEVPQKQENLSDLGEQLWSNVLLKCWAEITQRISLQSIITYFENVSEDAPTFVDDFDIENEMPEYQDLYYYEPPADCYDIFAPI